MRRGSMRLYGEVMFCGFWLYNVALWFLVLPLVSLGHVGFIHWATCQLWIRVGCIGFREQTGL